MARRKKTKRSVVDHLVQRYVGDDPRQVAEFEEVCANAGIARRIRALRLGAGLTQRQLADRIGTSHSVISRLEDDDYEGHSLSMLRRVAAALGKRVEVRIVDDPAA